ncbi:DUF6474 family protein [Corynebacterium flavescens]
MSIIKKLQEARAHARAEAKAAKLRTKLEMKEASKSRKRQQKLLARQEKNLLKTEQKGLKTRRKHEYKMAKNELDRLRQGRLNSSNIKRYAGALRTAAPLLLPLIYRAIVSLREAMEQRRARQAGVSADQLAAFAGHGASLQARLAGIRNSLEGAGLPAGFKRDARERLDDLEAAVSNAEFMTDQQRRRAHKAIESDIDGLTAEIQQRISR